MLGAGVFEPLTLAGRAFVVVVAACEGPDVFEGLDVGAAARQRRAFVAPARKLARFIDGRELGALLRSQEAMQEAFESAGELDSSLEVVLLMAE
jgi:hypothetical protein